ncbi:WD40/YVTN/BNR-like repeat-containing protein [Paenibacillus protaetiae]|uniref:Photosynthesis system II assembly factor Ycf48/Hcf136-like domain-containing protein n=1 Tax=Paenibacillus protaetiae TaxID=2509456 RepID=A0A4P6ESJ2_9BACL|nr:hypothetical protein [Paenibacillus protaetiae]QAY65864.1 hypothetical protein ET464_05185 [Paenibacillus protaetiae]
MKKWKVIIAATAMAAAVTAAVPMSQSAASPAGLFSGTPAGGDSYHFSAIQFLSSTTGRAAGNGFIVGTSDAGSSWQPIYKGTWQFSELDFINNTTGWALAKSDAVGPNALIYTKDGGSTFTKIKTGDLKLLHVDFKDANNGFGYNFAFAYRTSDGGKSWTQIPTPPNTRYADFQDTNNGWTLVVVPGFGYKLYETANGGKSWTMKLSVKSDEVTGGQLAVKGREVWAAFNGGAGMSQQSYSVYASADNGADWRKVISQSTAGGGPAPGGAQGIASEGPASPGGHPGNLELIDGAAVLAGYSPAGGVIGVGRSLDSGKSWTNLPAVPGFQSIISFTSQTSGWMADTSITQPAVYRTKDGGKSWTNVLTIPAR